MTQWQSTLNEVNYYLQPLGFEINYHHKKPGFRQHTFEIVNKALSNTSYIERQDLPEAWDAVQKELKWQGLSFNPRSKSHNLSTHQLRELTQGLAKITQIIQSQDPYITGIVSYTIPWHKKDAIKGVQAAVKSRPTIKLSATRTGLRVTADHYALANVGLTLPTRGDLQVQRAARQVRTAGNINTAAWFRHLSGKLTADLEVDTDSHTAIRLARTLVTRHGLQTVLIKDREGHTHKATQTIPVPAPRAGTLRGTPTKGARHLSTTRTAASLADVLKQPAWKNFVKNWGFDFNPRSKFTRGQSGANQQGGITLMGNWNYAGRWSDYGLDATADDEFLAHEGVDTSDEDQYEDDDFYEELAATWVKYHMNKELAQLNPPGHVSYLGDGDLEITFGPESNPTPG
jgi:hypothetical protein